MGSKPDNEVTQLLKPYQSKRQGVELSLKRTSRNTLLLKEKSVSGKVTYLAGRLRFETEPPEKSLFISDGKNLWLVQEIEGESPLINRLKSKDLKKGNSLLSIIFDPKALSSRLLLKKKESSESGFRFVYEPKENQSSELIEVVLEFSQDKRELSKVSYVDDRSNEVDFVINETQFVPKNKIDPKIFSYKPPKGAEVIDL